MAMKLAFSNSLSPELDLDTLIELSQAWGYDGIQFAPRDGKLNLPADLPTLRRKLDEAGQTLVCLHAGALSGQPDRHGLGAATQHARECVALAAEIGSPFVSVSGCRVPAGMPKVRAAEQDTLALRTLANEAIRQGVTLLFENAGAFSSSQDAWFLRDAAGVPALRLCLNVVNARAAGDPPSVAIPRLAAATSLLRLGDAQFGADHRVTGHVACGEGGLDVPRVVELLKGLAYEGWLCVHWPQAARKELPPAEELLPAAAKYLRGELDKPAVVLTAYSGDKNAPRFTVRPADPAPETES